ncbi:U32 family peptidase [Clostridiaceae bacterium HSG29]|nr:U32 family peptidase [Clostridiaceae bacterium HSG29]
MNKVELLAPAGNLEKLKFAVYYGADAVYLGGKQFGLRASSDNFTYDEMKEGIEYAHSRGAKVYLTLNIIPHNSDINRLEDYINEIKDFGFDAVIVSDPGIIIIVKELWKSVDIHLSTQANNTNYMSAKFWHEQGVSRVILARELSLKEITEINDKTPDTLEIEAFVHGAMCISYSGRCLLSSYMAGRDANRGACAQPCRWEYSLMEKTREGEYYPVYEDERGTYIFNSRDLNLIDKIKELIETGLVSLKIEGRMKSMYYVANIINTYREAIDKYYEEKDGYKFNEKWMENLRKSSHRKYTDGFANGKPGPEGQVYESSSYIREYDFIGIVRSFDKETMVATIEQRNRIFIGDEIEVIGPKYHEFIQKVDYLKDNKGNDIEVAPHPQQIIKIKMDEVVEEMYILRKKRS